MSEWLRPLLLKRGFRINVTDPIRETESLPDWVGFLIWAGWWMNRRSLDNKKKVLVLLLPTRMCCSAFCCLGALIRSIENGSELFSWDKFLELPEGSQVSLYYPDPKSPHRKVAVEGIVGRIIDKQTARQIKIISKHRSFKRLIHSVYSCKFGEYRITARSPVPMRWFNKVSNILPFYTKILNNVNPSSVLVWSKECLLITNLSTYRSEIEDIFVSVINNHYSFGLHELLMPSQDFNADYSGIFLASPKSAVVTSIRSPIAILNGSVAVKSWERISSPNIIVLLDQMEYDDSMENFIAQLSDARAEEVALLPEGIPENLPAGAEMSIFVLI